MNSTQPLTTVRDLARSISWKELEQSILNFYPSESEWLLYYKKLYWFLCNSDVYPVQQKVLLFFEKPNIHTLTQASYYEIEEENMVVNKEDWFKISNYFVEPMMFEETHPSEVLSHLLFELTYGDREFILALFQQ